MFNVAFSLQCEFYSVHIAICTLEFFVLQGSVCSVKCSMFNVQLSVCRVQGVEFSVTLSVSSAHCAMFSVQCLVWSVYCTLQTWNFTQPLHG